MEYKGTQWSSVSTVEVVGSRSISITTESGLLEVLEYDVVGNKRGKEDVEVSGDVGG